MIKFNITEFRKRFEAFSNTSDFPDEVLELRWEISVNYISDNVYGRLSSKQRELGLQLLTAHLLILQQNRQSGVASSQVSSVGEGRESVSFETPPAANNFRWWLGLTQYGQELLSLLEINSVGGLYIGGLPERSAFRKVGGKF